MNIIDQLGDLVFTLPAVVAIYALREAFRNVIIAKLGSVQNQFALFYVDILGAVVLAFYGASWGGLVNRNRKDNIISFVASQLFFMLVIGLLVFYFHMNAPKPDSYTYHFVIYMIKFSWILFYLNFVPLPPFDGAYFYMQRISSAFSFALLAYMTRAIVILILVFDVVPLDFLKADSFLHLVRII